MNTWMYNAIEITKYNPIFRDQEGAFVNKNEWTCYSEIGRYDDDGLLTREKYLSIEAKYLQTIDYFVKSTRLDLFLFSSIEIHSNKNDFLKEDSHLYNLYKKVKKKKSITLNIKDINGLCKLILRNYIWGDIILMLGKYEIHLGYDYYMYFVIDEPLIAEQVKLFAKKIGLFIGRSDESII